MPTPDDANLELLNKILVMFTASNAGERASAYDRFLTIAREKHIDLRDLRLTRSNGIDAEREARIAEEEADLEARRARYNDAMRAAYPDAARLAAQVGLLEQEIKRLKDEARANAKVGAEVATLKEKLAAEKTRRSLAERELAKRAEESLLFQVLRRSITGMPMLDTDKAAMKEAELLELLEIACPGKNGRDVLPLLGVEEGIAANKIPAWLRLGLRYLKPRKGRRVG